MKSYGLLLLAYFFTGINLARYDMDAPIQHRKLFLIQGANRYLIITWLFWPVTALFDTVMMYRARLRYFRFLCGVILLFTGIFFWSRLIHRLPHLFTSSELIAYLVTSVILVFTAPFISGLVMLHHDNFDPTGTDDSRQ